MSYDNTNRGQIWPNERKDTESHPDFKGSINVAGVEYWVSAWKRKPDANPKAPSLSFSIQAKEAREAPTDYAAGKSGEASKPQPAGEFDDIPF